MSQSDTSTEAEKTDLKTEDLDQVSGGFVKHETITPDVHEGVDVVVHRGIPQP